MSYPPPVPAGAGGPRVSPIRLPVLAPVVLAVIAIAGILLWGGGDTPSTASPTASGGDAFGSSGDTGGATAAGPGGVTGTTGVVPPLNPSDLAPIGGTPTSPQASQALLAWQVPVDWTSLLSTYQGFLTAPGYRLGDQRITDPGGAGAWDIIPDQPGPQVGVGLLHIGPDPANPNGTLVQVQVY